MIFGRVADPSNFKDINTNKKMDTISLFQLLPVKTRSIFNHKKLFNEYLLNKEKKENDEKETQCRIAWR